MESILVDRVDTMWMFVTAVKVQISTPELCSACRPERASLPAASVSGATRRLRNNHELEGGRGRLLLSCTAHQDLNRITLTAAANR